jgi:endonuclease YncB( thermonuclease family)
MAKKTSNGQAAPIEVSNGRIERFVRLKSSRYGQTTRPYFSDGELHELDKAYESYETFIRVYVDAVVDGETITVKSQPLMESGAKPNPNHKA